MKPEDHTPSDDPEALPNMVQVDLPEHGPWLLRKRAIQPATWSILLASLALLYEIIQLTVVAMYPSDNSRVHIAFFMTVPLALFFGVKAYRQARALELSIIPAVTGCAIAIVSVCLCIVVIAWPAPPPLPVPPAPTLPPNQAYGLGGK